MSETKRGKVLTVFAVLFVLLAVSDLTKPLELSSETGFVFLGARMKGTWNLILGPLFGIYLAVYAFGIYRMKRFAIGMAQAYALYVVLNLVLWNVRQELPSDIGYRIFGAIYTAIAVGVSGGAAYLLTRRRAELS